MLGLVVVAILTVSVGAALSFAAQPQYRQGGSISGMTGGRAQGAEMLGGRMPNTGGIMQSQGGVMGTFGNMMSGYPNMMGFMGSAMGRFGGMMGQMVQHMGNIRSSSRNGSDSGTFVAIMNYGYNPSSITVPKGTTVTWVNMDFDQHTVTSGTEKAPTGVFDSKPFSHL